MVLEAEKFKSEFHPGQVLSSCITDGHLAVSLNNGETTKREQASLLCLTWLHSHDLIFSKIPSLIIIVLEIRF